jgi:hypothetical protein
MLCFAQKSSVAFCLSRTYGWRRICRRQRSIIAPLVFKSKRRTWLAAGGTMACSRSSASWSSLKLLTPMLRAKLYGEHSV